MKNNKGPIINGEQLSNLLHKTLADFLVGVDLNPIPKTTLIEKFGKVKYAIDQLELKTKQREYDLQIPTITFDIGEHNYKYMNLNLTIILIHPTNKLLNKEMVINIPKSYFISVYANAESVLNPSISHITNSPDVELPTVMIGSKIVRDVKTQVTKKVLTLNILDNNFNSYSIKKILVSSYSTIFDVVDMTPSVTEVVSTYIQERPIEKIMNIGQHSFVENDGTLVFSNTVSDIVYTTHEEMTILLEANRTDPNKLYLVAEGNDESDRLLELRIKVLQPNTRFVLSNNNVQSSSFSVNWGDGESNKRVNHRYLNPGEYTIKIFNRIDDLRLDSSDNMLELLSISIPSGYRSPCEWNEPIINQPFNGDRFVGKITTFPGGIFARGNKIIRVLGIVKSDLLTTIEEDALIGLSSVSTFESQGLFKHVETLPDRLLHDMHNLKSAREMFKDSALTTVRENLLANQELLQDITGMFENSKLKNIPANLMATLYDLKIAERAFKNISTLNAINITPFFMSFISEKRFLKSIKSIFEDTPTMISFTGDTIALFNKCISLMDLSFAFKNSKIRGIDPKFILRDLPNLITVESLFENCTGFKVNTPLLNRCSNMDNLPIIVTNSLKGTVKNSDSLVSEDDLFISTSVEGSSGLF